MVRQMYLDKTRFAHAFGDELNHPRRAGNVQLPILAVKSFPEYGAPPYQWPSVSPLRPEAAVAEDIIPRAISDITGTVLYPIGGRTIWRTLVNRSQLVANLALETDDSESAAHSYNGGAQSVLRT